MRVTRTSHYVYARFATSGTGCDGDAHPLCQVKEEQIAADLAARKERYRQRRLAFAAAQVRPGITTRTAHT